MGRPVMGRFSFSWMEEKEVENFFMSVFLFSTMSTYSVAFLPCNYGVRIGGRIGGG